MGAKREKRVNTLAYQVLFAETERWIVTPRSEVGSVVCLYVV